jgi:methylisocitrate lyase
VVAPGCHDALSAKMAEAAGFPAVYISGYCLQATVFGKPNVGYATLTEYVDFARKMVDAIDIPVIIDAETGFGDVTDVRRAVREFESAGVAAIHIEDQVRSWTSHSDVKANLLTTDATCKKLASAKEAQRTDDLILIGRTDSASISAEEAIDRSNAFLHAGADVAMPMMSPYLPYSAHTTWSLADQTSYEGRLEVLRRFVTEINGPVATHCPHGLDYTAADVAATGMKLYTIPQLTLGPAAAAVNAALRAFQNGSIGAYFEANPPYPVKELSEFTGIAEYVAVTKRFASETASASVEARHK